jgi:pimeloyl-ACP methyl ester carboxylesterase
VSGARRTQVVAGRAAGWLEAGAGPPLVCLHGAGGSAELWAPQLDGLAGVARVVAPDLPGHGPLGGRGRPSVPAYADWVAAFLDALGLGPVVLAGHSMGGAIAQTLALTRPGRVAALILVATGARLRVLPRLIELLRVRPVEGRDLLGGLCYAPTTPRERVAVADRVLVETAPSVTLGDFLACDRFDVMDRLGTIDVPALVVAGTEDRLTPPKYGRFLAGAIPAARLAEIGAAGHFPHLEQPDAVNAAIRAFLADVVASAPHGAAARTGASRRPA